MGRQVAAGVLQLIAFAYVNRCAEHLSVHTFK